MFDIAPSQPSISYFSIELFIYFSDPVSSKIGRDKYQYLQ